MKSRRTASLRTVLCSVALTLTTASTFANTVTQPNEMQLPRAFEQVPQHALQRYQIPEHTSLQGTQAAVTAPQLLQFDANANAVLQLPIAGSKVRLEHTERHANGDVTVRGTVTLDGQAYQLLLTQGRAGVIGELRGASRIWLQQQGNQLYLLDIDAAGFVEPSYENDVRNPQTAVANPVKSRGFAPTVQQINGQEITVVDIMMLYASEVTEVYPNGQADTLMTQLVANANQAFVDSGVSMQLRIVHRQEVNYQKPSSIDALDDLGLALNKSHTGPIDSSLSQVSALRDQHGADLVSMIRIHELNERGLCGIAYFPDSDGDIVINVSNVGNSGGSICGKTFTHEIGHNFGAGHQFVGGNSVGARPTGGAWIVNGKFNTVMSSIGTGDVNRNYALHRFSNPDLTCAGVPCGDKTRADNAAAVNYFATINSSLRPAVSTELVNPPPVSNPDTDGDGVADVTDNFPFLASEQLDTDNDGIGDNADRFPNNSAEQRDSDLDGIGDNADTDDDNDGTLDVNDALPLDASDNKDSDADGVGDKTDELLANFQEFRDSDKDGIGNRFDTDNDNDGVADFDTRSNGKQQLLVVNAGSGQILALDPADGRKIDTLYQAPQGGFSFRSDIVNLSPGQLAFVQFSDIIRLDRLAKTADTLLKRAQINSAFSVGLLKTGEGQPQSRLWLSNGLNPSTFEFFDFTNSATQGNDNKIESENVWRDLLALNGKILMVERDTNKILSLDPNTRPLQNTVWASGAGLNKPEQLALLPDGTVLVTNAASRNVTRFNASGQYLGEFISAGSNGLGNPGCIAVDNLGNVYVCSTNTNKILKFNSNGAPVAELATATTVGLDQPVSLLLTGEILDTAPFDANNDSDADGVANKQDAFPLDPSRSAVEPTPPPAPAEKSGGSTGPVGLVGLLLLGFIRRQFCRYFL